MKGNFEIVSFLIWIKYLRNDNFWKNWIQYTLVRWVLKWKKKERIGHCVESCWNFNEIFKESKDAAAGLMKVCPTQY